METPGLLTVARPHALRSSCPWVYRQGDIDVASRYHVDDHRRRMGLVVPIGRRSPHVPGGNRGEKSVCRCVFIPSSTTIWTPASGQFADRRRTRRCVAAGACNEYMSLLCSTFRSRSR